MKKFLAFLLAMYLLIPASFGQDPEIRPAAIGVSFFLNDFATASRIRSSSMSHVLINKQWAKISDMAPGLAVSYFKGLRKHIDFAGTLAGSFLKYPMPDKTFSSDKFLLEGDASLNFKLVSEKYWVQPYAIAGIGASMYGGTYFGAFIPTGLGLKVNFYDDAHLYMTGQYRIPVTTETANYHFFYQVGIAGRIGKKYVAPVPKALPPAPVDTDKDGILDDADKCPTVPGVAKYDGCPVPDSDKDGINDDEDKCPTVPGLAKYQGCPVPDTDKDGINDEEDQCPNQPGVARYKGCPIPDTDGDGVNDEEDQCPRVAGPADNFGCPVIGIKSYEIVFKTGSAVLLPEGKKLLDTVVNYLKTHNTVAVTIDGHTDNTGSDKVNNPLSVKRAEATKAYIVSKGIDADRMTTAGFGSTQPIADNKTKEGRRMNRRIEIKIKHQ